MNEQSTYISCFFFFLFSFLLLVCSWFLFSFFFFFFSSSTLHCLLLFFLFFPRRSVPLIVDGLFLFFFSFYFFQFQQFSLSLFVDVELWCLKLSFAVTRFVLNPWRTLLAQAPNRTMLYSHLHVHAEIYIYILDTYRRNDNRRKNKGHRKEDTGRNDARRLL